MNQTHAEYALNRARAIHELQLQIGFFLKDRNKPLGYVTAAEFLNEEQWKVLKASKPQLILSAARAKILGIDEVKHAVAIDAGALSLMELQALIVGGRESLTFPFTKVEAPFFAASLIGLVKEAGIIPALVYISKTEIFADAYFLDIDALTHVPPVELIQGPTVSLPIEGAENSKLTSFRTRFGHSVHLALMIGDIKNNIPLVRVHSSCVTGDMLGSLRCDCGGQLQSSIKRMKEAGAGILLYMHQEGRGIGISSKLRAYALQERGLDTFAANEQLGFEEDERDFSIAAHILEALGQKNIRLLTNNPQKIEAFLESDISVSEKLPLVADPNSHNRAYLEAKHVKGGHHPALVGKPANA